MTAPVAGLPAPAGTAGSDVAAASMSTSTIPTTTLAHVAVIAGADEPAAAAALVQSITAGAMALAGAATTAALIA